MKRHKLLNNRNEKLFNRLLENQGLKHESSIKEEEKEEVTEGEMCPKCGKSPCVCEDKEEEGSKLDPLTVASHDEKNEEKVSEGIMAMHCPQCGTLNSKANNHCTNCGAKLKGDENVEEEKTEKHDDAPELEGDQKTELPDELQANIVKAKKEDK
jgi:uncharacterized OB-fold protein